MAVAGSFSDGSSEDLLKRFGSISRLQGLRYWSVTESGWRTLITHATALEGPDLDHPRKDFTLAEMKGGAELYFAQADNRTSGDVVYRMHVVQADASRLVIDIENVTAVRSFLIPLFAPGDLQSVHYLQRTAQGRWSYYGLAWAGETMSSQLLIPEASYVNRALALYSHFTGSPDSCSSRDEVAMVELNLEGHAFEIFRGKLERRLRQVDAVIVVRLGS